MRPQRRVRPGLPPPPPRQQGQRLPARIRGWVRKSPRIRGVLAVEVVRYRTRDRPVQGQSRLTSLFVSAAHLGGSVWCCGWREKIGMQVRVLILRFPAKPKWKFESLSLRHLVSRRRDFQPSFRLRSRKTTDSAGFWKNRISEADRRRRVRGPNEPAARVFLCRLVGRFGFAFDSPSEGRAR
jgi:hypothetical protein